MDIQRHIAVAFLAFAASALEATADPISDSVGEVLVLDAVTEPAPKGSYASVSLRIENGGMSPVTVIQVETAQGEPGEFRFHGSQPHPHAASAKSARPSMVLRNISIAPGEEVALDTHHLHLFVGPLKRDLRNGDVLELTFVFEGGWSVALPVHVHAKWAQGR